MDSGWHAALCRGGQSAEREGESQREGVGLEGGKGAEREAGREREATSWGHCLCPSRGARAEEAETLSVYTAAAAARLADGGRCSRRLSTPLLRTGQLLAQLFPSLRTEPRLEDGDDRTLAIRPANLVEAPRSSGDLAGDLGEVTQPRRRSKRGGGAGEGGG